MRQDKRRVGELAVRHDREEDRLDRREIRQESVTQGKCEWRRAIQDRSGRERKRED